MRIGEADVGALRERLYDLLLFEHRDERGFHERSAEIAGGVEISALLARDVGPLREADDEIAIARLQGGQIAADRVSFRAQRRQKAFHPA